MSALLFSGVSGSQNETQPYPTVSSGQKLINETLAPGGYWRNVLVAWPEARPSVEGCLLYTSVTAEIKLEVKPNRAAVFVDGVFVGHIAEFEGPGKALLVAPGKHKIKISLPGYHTFETEIDLVANQKSTVKTEMVAGGPAEGTPLPK